MDFVIDFVKVLSLASVVLAALWLIVPKGYSARLFKYAMGLFMVAIIVATLNISALDFKLSMPSLDTEASVNVAARLTNSTAVYVIERLLNECGIKFKEVNIITDNSAGSDINITKAYIELVNDGDFERAAEIIKNQTGIIAVAP